eukprot:11096558-Heterocapsa_arctica.AAC.1
MPKVASVLLMKLSKTTAPQLQEDCFLLSPAYCLWQLQSVPKQGECLTASHPFHRVPREKEHVNVAAGLAISRVE